MNSAMNQSVTADLWYLSVCFTEKSQTANTNKIRMFYSSGCAILYMYGG